MTTIVAYRGLGCRDATRVFFATSSEADGVRDEDVLDGVIAAIR